MAPDLSVHVRVPGRINLIGDHTDYTGGLVLPTVVDLHTEITGEFTDGDVWRLDSESHGLAVIELDPDRALNVEAHWARYPAGVLSELLRRGIPIRGFTGKVSTNIPIGGGLSSSAALEVATARVVLAHAVSTPTDLTNLELARMCQHAEHIATGVPCGIMDQLSILAGRRGAATLIDCSSFQIDYVDLPDDIAFEHRFIAARQLVGSEYSVRVAQCEEIEAMIGPLRLASLSDVDRIRSEVLRRRARHVVTENDRVRAFADAVSAALPAEAGRLMTESHRSLAEDYETSNTAMDSAVESALSEPGVLGARMTGGGFGGCIVVMKRR